MCSSSYFSTLLSNLSPKEAKFLLLFKGKNSLIGDYVKNSIALANIKFYDSTMSNHSTYSVDNILLKCDDQNKIKSFSQEIDILKSLGIVQRSIGSFDEQLRDDLEEIKSYQIFRNSRKDWMVDLILILIIPMKHLSLLASIHIAGSSLSMVN